MEAIVLEPSKTPYIVVTVVFFLILIGLAIFIWYSRSNDKYLFAPYEPPSGPEWFYPTNKKEYVPLTPEQAELRTQLLEQALVDVRLHQQLNQPVTPPGPT